MKCPEEIRICPEGWTDCTLCRYESLCIAGFYKPEELAEHELTIDLGIEIKEAEVKLEDHNGAKEKSRGTWYNKYMEMSEEERWAEYRRYRPPSLLQKEPWQAMSGPSAPGGGGSGKVPKKPKKKMPEYLKTFGQ